MKYACIPLALAMHLCAQAQGPLFHWPLDEGTGSVAHAWGGSHGTLVGGVTWSPAGGHHQGCARFDGVDDRIVLGPCDITTGNGAFSLSLWAKADFVTGMDRTLMAKSTGPNASDQVWAVAFVSGSGLRFRLRAAGNSYAIDTGPSSLFGGQWYHIVGTYDGAQMRLYLNGSLMGTATASGLIGLHPQSPASIGALSTGAQPFSGWIDDVRIYGRALSAAEVMELLMEQMITSITGATSPTVVDGAVNVPAGIHRITIHDQLGRLLHETRAQGPAMLPLPAEGLGLLLIGIEGQDGRTTVRTVLQ
ncbi:MAG: LamG domain-containing protein [Flavobacteriales bacterium]|nr:LamG domain-containing protein [Flavobacteriales bacterium]